LRHVENEGFEEIHFFGDKTDEVHCPFVDAYVDLIFDVWRFRAEMTMRFMRRSRRCIERVSRRTLHSRVKALRIKLLSLTIRSGYAGSCFWRLEMLH
jgi:hypothetical protein